MIDAILEVLGIFLFFGFIVGAICLSAWLHEAVTQRDHYKKAYHKMFEHFGNIPEEEE